MRKLINDPSDVVVEALRGFGAAHRAHIVVDEAQRVVTRGEAPRVGKVGLVSGGGSGHEPLHAGFVGSGMLDAAVCGEVFTSPVPDQILAATRAVDGGAGVLYLVKNYTGDVLNFEMAAELAADAWGIPVSTVLIDDDIAVQDSLYTAGRRGVAGTVLVEKIAGALAETGADLETVTEIARRVVAGTRSMGVALSSATVPAAGCPTFDLDDGEMELGIGIHGEPGRERRPLGTAAEIAAALVEPILADLDYVGSQVIVLVNGLGATPLIELYLMFAEVQTLLEAAGVTVARSLVGDYVTSLDMAGCSVSLLRAEEDLVALWDAPVNTAALRWGA